MRTRLLPSKSNLIKNITVISTIGHEVPDKKNPIYEALNDYNINKITLLWSKENKDPKKVLSNFDKIKEYYSISNDTEIAFVDVPIDIFRYEENVWELASIIKKEYSKYDSNLIIDLSGGRGLLRLTVLQAGHLYLESIKSNRNKVNDISIWIKGKGLQAFRFSLSTSLIPNSTDQKLMKILDSTNSIPRNKLADFQNYLAKTINKNQSTISRRLQVLSDVGYFDPILKRLTLVGKNALGFMEMK